MGILFQATSRRHVVPTNSSAGVKVDERVSTCRHAKSKTGYSGMFCRDGAQAAIAVGSRRSQVFEYRYLRKQEEFGESRRRLTSHTLTPALGRTTPRLQSDDRRYGLAFGLS